MRVIHVPASQCHHLAPSKRANLQQHGPQMGTLAGTRLSMCLKPQQTAEMNAPHSKAFISAVYCGCRHLMSDDQSVPNIPFMKLKRWPHQRGLISAVWITSCEKSLNQRTQVDCFTGYKSNVCFLYVELTWNFLNMSSQSLPSIPDSEGSQTDLLRRAVVRHRGMESDK